MSTLDSVIIKNQLAVRPPRPPDYEGENAAMMKIAKSLRSTPAEVLQTLANSALELCQSDSAGVSILENDHGVETFRWAAIVGQFASNVGGGMARAASPCGEVIQRDQVMLFAYPERHYPYAVVVEPPIVEALLLPFHADEKAVGTIWVIAHTESRKFDAEGVRLMRDLGRFASNIASFSSLIWSNPNAQ